MPRHTAFLYLDAVTVDFDALVDEMRREHRVHTVILYGSRARGDATLESDLDVAGFADITDTRRDCRVWSGTYLDAFVYPTATTSSSDLELLKLRGGRVLLDERALARSLLDRLDAVFAAGPPALGDAERNLRIVWARKMLARIRRGDVEAHYRRHWLLFQLLEDYFALRGEWFGGPKTALHDLEISDPVMFDAFRRALAPEAPLDALEHLVECITL